MGKRDVDEFEQALQRAARGEVVEPRQTPLVHSARQVMALSVPPPMAPHGLEPGRRRFLLEAARLRAQRASQRRYPRTAWRVATLLLIAILGAVALGGRFAVADSLPGQPTHGLKLLVEKVSLALTVDPARRAATERTQSEERLDEIAALLEQERAIEDTWVSQAERQLQQALQTAAQLEDAAAVAALQRLADAVRQREQAMAEVAGEPVAPPMQHLLRVMEQVRQEADAGQGDPDGLRQRLRQGVPTAPPASPPPTATPRPSRTPGPQPSGTLRSPSPSRMPGPSHTPQPRGMPDALPGAGGMPAHTPGSSATPHPTAGPPASRTPGAGATARPTEPPHATPTPETGGPPQATAGPHASRTPEPNAPPPTEPPRAQQTAEPRDTPAPGGGPGPGPEPGSGGGGGDGDAGGGSGGGGGGGDGGGGNEP